VAGTIAIVVISSRSQIETAVMKREASAINSCPSDDRSRWCTGIPFSRIEEVLKKCESRDAIETMPLDHLELSRTIGDLCCSINKRPRRVLQDQLIHLRDRDSNRASATATACLT